MRSKLYGTRKLLQTIIRFKDRYGKGYKESRLYTGFLIIRGSQWVSQILPHLDRLGTRLIRTILRSGFTLFVNESSFLTNF